MHPKVVAIGEIGLDYFHGAPKGWSEGDYRERQMAFFTRQLELAAQLGKNVIVHNRDRSEKVRPCWNETLQTVLSFSDRLRAVLHCHTSDWESAKPLVEEGHLISFTGIVTYRSAAIVLGAAALAGAGQFMVETDAPYLAPVPHRGGRCQPGYTRDTAECIAKARHESIESLAAHTTETAERFFGLS
jgi:TatD DNase family protein